MSAADDSIDKFDAEGHSTTTRVMDGDHCDMSISYVPSQALHGADPALALWNLLARPTIDPAALARAIETVTVEPNLDWRTLQLVTEGWEALEESIEPGLLNDYLRKRTAIQVAEAIRARTDDAWNSHSDVKFPSLKERLMPHVSPTTIRQFLRELGSAIAHPATITMGGAASLVFRGLLSRATEDVHVVDEVPAEIRDEYQILDELSARYGLAHDPLPEPLPSTRLGVTNDRFRHIRQDSGETHRRSRHHRRKGLLGAAQGSG